MATMDLDSDDQESQVVQTDGSLGNQKEATEILDAELERIVVPPQFKGKEYEGVVFDFSDYVPSPDSQQLQKAEFLPTARQNVSVRELTVVLPISTCYSLSQSWLLNRFPRPMVKLKFIAQHDEDMDNEGNVQWVLAEAGKDRIYVVVLEELRWLASKWFTMPKVKMKSEGVGRGDLMTASALMETHEFQTKMEYVVDNLAIFGKRRGNSICCAKFAGSLVVHRSYCLSFKWVLDWEPKPTVKMKLMNEDIAIYGKEVLSHQPEIDVKDERSVSKEETYGAIPGARWAERFLLKAAFNNSHYRLFIWLLVRLPEPNVRMKLMKFAIRDGYEEEFTNLEMADKKGSKEVLIAPTSPNEQSPCNNKKLKPNDVSSYPYILRSSHLSTTNPKVGNLFGVSGKIEVVHFLKQGDLRKSVKSMKDVILSLAQQSAPAVNASSLISLSLKKLLLRFPKPVVKMKFRAVLTTSWISDIDLPRHIFTESLHQLKNNEDDFDFVESHLKFNHNCSIVGLGMLWRCTNMLAVGSSPIALDFRRNYIFETIDIGSPRLGMDHIDGLIEQHCSVVEEEQRCSASSLEPSKRRFEVSDVIKPKFRNKKLWLQRLKEDQSENGLMSIVYLFDRCEVVIRHDPFEVLVRERGETGKEVLSSDGLFELEQLREEDQTAWNGEFSSMMLMLLVDQKRNDTLWMSGVNVIKTCQFSDIGWLVSIWFPKPRVKLKLGKMRHKMLGSMIPCGQGILKGKDCCNHKLKNEKKSPARNACSFMCTTTYIPAGCHVSMRI